MPNDCCSDVVGCVGPKCLSAKHFNEVIKDHSLFRQILASSAGSIVSTLSLNPITVVKVRLQNTTLKTNNKQSLISVVRKVFLEQGILGFWSGTRMGIIMSAPNTVLYMSAYEELKIILSPNLPNQISAISPAIAGAIARLISVTAISPLELIRTIQTGGATGTITQITKDIIRVNGLSGLYRGWGSSVLRDCPFSAIYWLGFDTLRPVYSKIILNRSSGSISVQKSFPAFVTFLSGATAGMIAAICTHPFDVVKTQQQVAALKEPLQQQHAVEAHGVSKNKLNRINSGIASSRPICNAAATNAVNTTNEARLDIKYSITTIYNNGGIRALFRGLSMRLATVIPASAIMVTIYETLKTIDI